MKILIINGPNLNLLGIREKQLYGTDSYDAMVKNMQNHLKKNNITGVFFQSNSQGAIIDTIQNAKGNFDGIIINPGAYTHTSLAIADALKIAGIPTVEVHVSAVEKREDFRQVSFIRPFVIKTITGHGISGYIEAVDTITEYYSGTKKQ